MTSKRTKINFGTINGPEGEKGHKISGEEIAKARKRIATNMKEIIQDFKRKEAQSFKDSQKLKIQ
jgi:hypothetical protein